LYKIDIKLWFEVETFKKKKIKKDIVQFVEIQKMQSKNYILNFFIMEQIRILINILYIALLEKKYATFIKILSIQLNIILLILLNTKIGLHMMRICRFCQKLLFFKFKSNV
jgi:hypothetical protein